LAYSVVRFVCGPHVANDELKCQRHMVNLLRHRVEHCLPTRFCEQSWLEVGAEVFARFFGIKQRQFLTEDATQVATETGGD
jgi:hypothetical protein